MSYSHLKLNIENTIAHCQLNRPEKRNALNLAMITELTDVFADLAQRSDCRVLLLSAAGPAFSAGADLTWMQQSIKATPQQNLEEALLFANCLQHLYHCPIPTIALIQGPCYGGANGLVAACDFAIAHSKSLFCFSEVSLGLIPAIISPYVVNCMGLRATRQVFLTAQPFSAATAQQHQLITDIQDDVGIAGHALATMILQNQPQALTACKRLLRDFERCPIDPALSQRTAQLLADIRTDDEAQKALQAYLALRSR